MFMSDVDVEEEPTAAYWVSLVGGALGVVASFVILGIAAWLASLASNIFANYTGPSPTLIGAIGIWGLISSVVVVAGAMNLKDDPWEHTKWGVIILVFSVIGLASLLGLIGGILALVYKPEQSVPYHPAAEATKRFCPNCGRMVNEGTRFCPYCGVQVGW